MKILIEFYLPFREIIGVKKIELEIEEKITITLRELLKKIITRYPALLKLFSTNNIEIIYQNITVLKSGNLLLPEAVLTDGDIIKIFSPMSGG